MIARRLVPALAILAMLAGAHATPAVAQDPPPPVFWYYEMEVHPADMPDFNEGLTGWAERLEEDGETWTWDVYQSVTGPPRFTIMTPFHNFADFDRDPIVSGERMAENEEYMAENLTPYIRNPVSTMMVHRDDVSMPRQSPEPPAYWQVTEWEVENSTMAYAAIQNAMMKVKEAFTSVNEMAVAAGETPGAYNVFDVMTGDGPTRIMIAFPMDALGDMDGGDPFFFFNTMVATHGHEDAVMVEEVFAEYTKVARMHIWAHRPDVSHVGAMGSN